MEVRPRQKDLTEYSAEDTESSNRAIEIKKVLLKPDWPIKTMEQMWTQRISTINDNIISLQFLPILIGLGNFLQLNQIMLLLTSNFRMTSHIIKRKSWSTHTLTTCTLKTPTSSQMGLFGSNHIDHLSLYFLQKTKRCIFHLNTTL